MALPQLESAVAASATAQTSVSGTLSRAPLAREVLALEVIGDTTAQTLVSNDGLTFRTVRSQTGSGTSCFILLRVCDGTEPQTLSFRRADSASDNFSVNITLWSGVNNANPFYAIDIITVANSDTCTIPAQNAGIDDTVVLTFLGIPSTTTVLTPPSGYTLAAEVDGFNPGVSSYYIEQPTAGSTGTVVWVTAAVANSLKGFAMILRPDPGYSYVQGIVTAGVNTPNGVANDWVNPGNVTADDGSATQCTLNGVTIQDFLDATDPDFANLVPTGSTIRGYEVEIERIRTGGTTGAARDGTLQLLDNGSAVGSNLAVTTQWPIDAVILLYGHPDNLWGSTISVANIRAGLLGVRLGIRGAAAGADRIGNVDFIRVTVYFDAPAFEAQVGAVVKIRAAATGLITAPVPTPDDAQPIRAGSSSGASRPRKRQRDWEFARDFTEDDEAWLREKGQLPPLEAEPPATTGEPEILATRRARADRDARDLAALLALDDEE